jgi:C_GCAxxG_C_C family probable redox protein
MLAVGEQLLGQMDDLTLRMTTGFAGGVGCTKRDLCGALTAGIMVIGALHGRSNSEVDDGHCQALAARYRDQFAQSFGATNCHQLRENRASCVSLVEEAARILLDVVESE